MLATSIIRTACLVIATTTLLNFPLLVQAQEQKEVLYADTRNKVQVLLRTLFEEPQDAPYVNTNIFDLLNSLSWDELYTCIDNENIAALVDGIEQDSAKSLACSAILGLAVMRFNSPILPQAAVAKLASLVNIGETVGYNCAATLAHHASVSPGEAHSFTHSEVTALIQQVGIQASTKDERALMCARTLGWLLKRTTGSKKLPNLFTIENVEILFSFLEHDAYKKNAAYLLSGLALSLERLPGDGLSSHFMPTHARILMRKAAEPGEESEYCKEVLYILARNIALDRLRDYFTEKELAQYRTWRILSDSHPPLS